MRVALWILMLAGIAPAASISCFTGRTLISSTLPVACGPLTISFEFGGGGAQRAPAFGEQVIPDWYSLPDKSLPDDEVLIQLLSVTLENAGQVNEFIQLTFDFGASGPVWQIGFDYLLQGWTGGTIGFPGVFDPLDPSTHQFKYAEISVCDQRRGDRPVSWISCQGGLPLAYATQGIPPVQGAEALQADDGGAGIGATFITVNAFAASAATVSTVTATALPTHVGRVLTDGRGELTFNLYPSVSTPEPASWLLAGGALLGLLRRRRRGSTPV